MWTFLILLFIYMGLYFLFKDTMNRLQYVGPIYWITRDIGKTGDPVLSVGFMRQTSYPWKTGRGVQVRIKQYTFQIGICKAHKNNVIDEETGLLHALGGRLLEDDVTTIRKWK